MKINQIGRWGMSSFSGILVLIFGFIALLFPNIAVSALAIYFALAILIGGVVLTMQYSTDMLYPIGKRSCLRDY